MRSLVGAIQAVDDSDGHFGVLRDRLQDIFIEFKQIEYLDLTGDAIALTA